MPDQTELFPSSLSRTQFKRLNECARLTSTLIPQELWQEHTNELPMSREELRQEYEKVIKPNGIYDVESYLMTVRPNRPRITRQQRKDAWPIFRSFQRDLKRRNLLTFEGAIQEAWLAVEKGNVLRYSHVLVDEVQDFSLETLTALNQSD